MKACVPIRMVGKSFYQFLEFQIALALARTEQGRKVMKEGGAKPTLRSSHIDTGTN